MEEAFSKEESPSLTTLATLAYNISSSSCLEATDEETGGRGDGEIVMSIFLYYTVLAS